MSLSVLTSPPGFRMSQISAPMRLNYLLVLLTRKQTSCSRSPLKVSKQHRGKWEQGNEANLMCIIGKKASFKRETNVSCHVTMMYRAREIQNLNFHSADNHFPCTGVFTISLPTLILCMCTRTHTHKITHIHTKVDYIFTKTTAFHKMSYLQP